MPEVIKVYYGADRQTAEREIQRELGEGHEVYEGRELRPEDLPNLFLGGSLFAEMEERKVLLKDLGEEKRIWDLLATYADKAGVQAIVWEVSVDKRTVTYKELAAAGIEFKEFPLFESRRKVEFEILDLALAGDVKGAVELVDVLEKEAAEPYMFFGLMSSQLVRKYEQGRQQERMRKLIRRLAEVDMLMKTSPISPWTAIRGFIAQASAIR